MTPQELNTLTDVELITRLESDGSIVDPVIKVLVDRLDLKIEVYDAMKETVQGFLLPTDELEEFNNEF